MQTTDQPSLIQLPFAASGGRSVIPVPSQIGITDGAASWTDGFPPLTRTPKSSGGKAPNGLDMNGVLYAISANMRWWNAGGNPKRSSAFQAAVGGYPSGAILQSSDNVGWWRCTADNNPTDPEAGGAGWEPIQGYGVQPVTMTGSNVTLTPLQALRRQIVITGALVANVNLILPASRQEWLVLNGTTGNFTITAKTASGSGVSLLSGPNVIYGDGANIGHATTAQTVLGTNGRRRTPDGLLEQWGVLSIGDVPSTLTTYTITFGIPFPVACDNLQLTVMDTGGFGNLKTTIKTLGASSAVITLSEDYSSTQAASVHWRALGR